MTEGVLRVLLKNLVAFRSLFEAEGVDTIYGPDGVAYSLHDLEYLYSQRVHLSDRQRQAIELFLVQNLKEKDVARWMGVSESTPVAQYATDGMKKIIKLVDEGKLNRFRWERDEDGAVALRGASHAGGSGRRADPGVAGGGYLDEREVGHLDAVEADGPASEGGVHGVGGSGRIVATWHVSPGMESVVPRTQQYRREGTGRIPRRWVNRAASRTR
jgi:predicted DNA-binding protein (UPF0251 family)